MSRRFSWSRMALTAAWSAAFSSPRPTSRAEASAAASDTRARPSESRRSWNSLASAMICPLLASARGLAAWGRGRKRGVANGRESGFSTKSRAPSDLFDADRHRGADQNAGGGEAGHGMGQVVRRGLVGDDQDGGIGTLVAI